METFKYFGSYLALDGAVILLIRLDDGSKPGEVLNVLRWVPSVVGTTAPREALIEIDDVLREKPMHVPIVPKIT